MAPRKKVQQGTLINSSLKGERKYGWKEQAYTLWRMAALGQQKPPRLIVGEGKPSMPRVWVGAPVGGEEEKLVRSVSQETLGKSRRPAGTVQLLWLAGLRGYKSEKLMGLPWVRSLDSDNKR